MAVQEKTTVMITIRVEKEDRELARRVARETGVNLTGLILSLIKREARTLGIKVPDQEAA